MRVAGRGCGGGVEEDDEEEKQERKKWKKYLNRPLASCRCHTRWLHDVFDGECSVILGCFEPRSESKPSPGSKWIHCDYLKKKHLFFPTQKSIKFTNRHASIGFFCERTLFPDMKRFCWNFYENLEFKHQPFLDDEKLPYKLFDLFSLWFSFPLWFLLYKLFTNFLYFTTLSDFSIFFDSQWIFTFSSIFI